MEPDEADQLSSRMAARLASHAGFAPLAHVAAEIQRFSDHDLASLVEARCGQVLDPNDLDDSAREAWLQHTAVRDEISTPEDNGPRYYWLCDGATRVGTIAFWVLPHGRGAVYISSLYVVPAHRSRGWARRGLTALREVAFAEGARETRLETSWCSQPVRQGFSDGGGPEGLAFKIRHFEAWARKNDWVVDTPRVPGLDYPSWDDLG